MTKKYDNLFEPIKIGRLQLKNRLVMAPMGPGGMVAPDGAFNQRGVDYYVERAKGGVGLIITGLCYVENETEKSPMPSFAYPLLNPASFTLTGAEMIERIHAYDTKIFLQLTAGFGQVMPETFLIGDPIAPSPMENLFNPKLMCREITTEEVERMVERFAQTAYLAKKVGFDGVEIHAVHEGYLLDQFTMAFYNKRTDKYGGDLMGRLRFPIEIVQAIKEKCGKDYPVCLRYSVKSYIKGLREGGLPGEDFVELGRDLAEGLEVAKILEEAGYDAFDADAGSHQAWYWNHPPMYLEKGCYLPFTEKLKKAVNVPVMAAGRLDEPDMASQALNQNKTDLVVIGRGLLADPQLPLKIKKNKVSTIRPCLGCHNGCMGRIDLDMPISCAVNPEAGREQIYFLNPAKEIKNVFIVGGGVAGMEAARVSAIRGHRVSLYEKSNRLGGNLIPASVPDFKEDDGRLIKWYEGELERLNVKITMNKEVDKKTIDEKKPDVIFIATGSRPKMIRIPGIDNKELFTAEDVYLGNTETGNSVVIIGGGLVGCELALWLSKQEKRVMIIEMQDKILQAETPIPFMNSLMLSDLLKYNKVSIRTGAIVEKRTKDGLVIKTKDGEEIVQADSVVISIGYNPERKLYDSFMMDKADTYLLGDARKVQNIMHAIWEAYEVAKNV